MFILEYLGETYIGSYTILTIHKRDMLQHTLVHVGQKQLHTGIKKPPGH
jgi:hypothetical protein